jgi:signal transduction histidine kinase
VALVAIAAVLFKWTVDEAQRQRRAFEDALIQEASLLADSLGPGLEAASNASQELDELVLWKLLDNARLLADLVARPSTEPIDLVRYLEANGLDSIVFTDTSGQATTLGERVAEEALRELEPLIAGEAEDLILGSTTQHTVRHLAAGARIPGGGAVLVRVEWSAAHTFAHRLGVENLLLDLLGTGAVLYLSYEENPGGIIVEGAWNGGPVPEPLEESGLREVYGRPIFEVNVPLEVLAGSTATLRVGLDGAPLIAVARQTTVRNRVIGLVLAGFAIAGTAFAFVTHLRSHEREEAARRVAKAEAARLRSERLAAAGALTAGLAHEVRSPMNAIGIAAQRLERKLPEGDERREVAARVSREVRRLDGVLREFLELANPVSSRREEVELAELCREVLELLDAEAEELEVRLDGIRGRGRAWIDREAVRRALMNLVRNAIQASPPAGRITVDVIEKAGESMIRITDQGTGVDPELGEHVFDPFVSGRKDGTGLGLALVRRVAEEHSGTVQLRSLPSHGAEATMRLPSREAR